VRGLNPRYTVSMRWTKRCGDEKIGLGLRTLLCSLGGEGEEVIGNMLEVTKRSRLGILQIG